MKGITPVIAIVLLLMITITLVGFAFIWFQSTFQQITATVTRQIDQQTTAIGKMVRIDSITIDSIAIRNVGSQNIAANEIAVFVDDEKQTYILPNDIIVGKVVSYTLNTPCTSSKTVKVTSPGGSDKTTC